MRTVEMTTIEVTRMIKCMIKRCISPERIEHAFDHVNIDIIDDDIIEDSWETPWFEWAFDRKSRLIGFFVMGNMPEEDTFKFFKFNIKLVLIEELREFTGGDDITIPAKGKI
jgi:hypothetical protein